MKQNNILIMKAIMMNFKSKIPNFIINFSMIMQQNLQLSMAETICNCAVKAAYEMHAALIIVFTNSGTSAILVSKYRP